MKGKILTVNKREGVHASNPRLLPSRGGAEIAEKS